MNMVSIKNLWRERLLTLTQFDSLPEDLLLSKQCNQQLLIIENYLLNLCKEANINI